MTGTDGVPVELLVLEYSPAARTDPTADAQCSIECDEDGLRLHLRLGGLELELPVVVGEPEGTVAEIAPGVMAWEECRRYGLELLGGGAMGAWKVEPSLWIPGILHAYLILRNVPEDVLSTSKRIVMP